MPVDECAMAVVKTRILSVSGILVTVNQKPEPQQSQVPALTFKSIGPNAFQHHPKPSCLGMAS